MAQRIVIIGAGFGGLSAAGLLAKQGHAVTVVVYQRWFHQMGTSAEAELDLRRLSPSYRVYFGARDVVDVPADLPATLDLFDTFEPGGGKKLERYLERAAYQYGVAMNEFVYRDYQRITDFFNRRMLVEGARLNVFTNLDRYVRGFFDSDRARKVLEYSMVFLGGAPDNTPALYNIMSHVDLAMGVWYPMGGMGAVVTSMQRLAEAAGARFAFNQPVRRIVVHDGRAVGVETAAGPRRVAMMPRLLRRNTFRFSRSAVNADAGAPASGALSVWMSRNPMLYGPWRPVSRAPPTTGTAWPPLNPMRRL